MSSALDTLLEAARFIEQQEQRQTIFSPSASPPFSSSGAPAPIGRYFYENGTNNNNNIISSSSSNIPTPSSTIRNNNNSRHSITNQVSSPPISPASFVITNGNNGINGGGIGTVAMASLQHSTNNNHTGSTSHDFTEFNNGSILTNGRSAIMDGRIEEPFTNGHSSVTSSYKLIPRQENTRMQCDDDDENDDGGVVGVVGGTITVIDNQNKSNINYTINHSYHDDKNTSSILNSLSLNSIPITRKKVHPLTPPPVSSRKLCESSRIRSVSLSSNKITANEDSSQSSMNLSSSGYLSGGSMGGSGSNMHLNGGGGSASVMGGVSAMTINGGELHSHHLAMQGQSATGGRRRTTSTNSNGAGTREVHNKLEKHRRAHLKECFEQLKIQLQLKDEEKKKTSNLAILDAALRQVVSLRNKEQELEQQVEQLAKDKINAQKTITCLKRGLSSKLDNIDLSNIITDVEIGNIPAERVTESLSDSVSLSSGRGSMRYSSSSSLSSGGNTISSPLGAGMQSTMPNNMSPVISSSTSLSTSPSSPNLKLSSSPLANSMPLSLTAKNISATSLTRGSPTPSTPSPSPSSSGVSSSSSIMSSSPPNGLGLKVPNIPTNGLKLANGGGSPPKNGISLTTANGIINLGPNDANCIAISTATGLPLNLNASHSMHSAYNGKNGLSRKTESRDNSSLPQQQIIYAAAAKNQSNFGCAKDVVMDEGEQPAKVIKVLNGYALASVDKDNKILSSAPLSLSAGGGLVVSQFPMLSAGQGLRVIGGPNGMATIELSSANVQSQSRCFTQTVSPPMTTTCATNGAQLHKLLVSGNGSNGAIEHGASELGRLPGGAELNILPTATNGTTLYRGSSKLGINGITLKGSDITSSNGRALHVVTPLQSGHNGISGLTPIVVSQGQSVNNLAHIIASPQLAGKVNLSVGGQAVPLLNTQYLGPMKPMVVVASNANPTFSSVPPTQTTATLATGTTNGNAL